MVGAWKAVTTGIVVRIRLTPNACKSALEGMATTADGQSVIKARVSAQPEKGMANRSLIVLLSSCLDIAPSRIALTAGDTSRLKVLTIEGDAYALSKRLATLTLPE